MFGGEIGGGAMRLVIGDQVDPALSPQLHILAAMVGDMGKPHRGKDMFEQTLFRGAKFDELKTIKAERVVEKIGDGSVHGRGFLWPKLMVAILRPKRCKAHNLRMDATDRKILARLQIDASLSHAELGELVNLSASQVSRRVQRLEQDGIIRKQVILLDEEAVGLQVEAYVSLSLASYNPGDIARFHERMCSLEEVLECCATTGGEDYFLRV
ncbi:hypothetical protein E4T56_gene6099, partial [Termitomyces sp. T112]